MKKNKNCDNFDEIFYEKEFKEACEYQIEHAKSVVNDLDKLLKKGRMLPPKDRISIQLAIEIIKEEYHI